MIRRLRRAWPGPRLAALSFLFGAVAALGQAPWEMWYLTFPAFGVIFYAHRHIETPGMSAWVGWCVGAGYFTLALFWITEPFQVDLARHGVLIPFALFFLCGGLALFWALAFWLAGRVLGMRRPAMLIVTWTGAEILRGSVLTGFPWASIGHTLIATPFLQLASLGGAHLLTLICLALAAGPVLWPVARGLAASLAAGAALWVGGAVLLTPGSGAPGPDAPVIRLVQPNAEQHLKWDSDWVPVFFQRQLEMTRAGERRPDLVVWPETAIAWRLSNARSALDEMAKAAAGVPIVFGANDFDEGYRNTLAVLDAEGGLAARYYKHHLVPFGEYIPFGDLLANFGVRGLAARDQVGFRPGPGPALIDLPGIGPALPLICYELIFPRNLRQTPRPRLILQVTNDAWFGEISGPYQHLAQARLRAVEQGLPLLRAANTGVSAVIDAQGRVSAQTALGEARYLDAALPPALPPTLYARLADWPLFGVLLLLLAGLLLDGRRRSRAPSVA